MFATLTLALVLHAQFGMPHAAARSHMEAPDRGGLAQGEPISAEAIGEVADNASPISPDLIWEQQSNGRRWPPREPSANITRDQTAAFAVLSAGWATTGNQTDWEGTHGLVTHLSPPGEPARAVFRFSDGHLYLVERRKTGWQARRLTEIHADETAVVDLSGDGQPEIIAASQHGSGAHLALQVFAWDRQRVWLAYSHNSAKEPGTFGWFDAEGDGQRELWIDSSAARGLFTGTTHGPFFRDRTVFRWERGTYRQAAKYRFATPFYHLNRYLYFASTRDWKSASRHAEPEAAIDRALAARLGLGPFSGGSDIPFVNGRIYFGKDGQDYFADFGPTGRLLRLGRGSLRQPADLVANRMVGARSFCFSPFFISEPCDRSFRHRVSE